MIFHTQSILENNDPWNETSQSTFCVPSRPTLATMGFRSRQRKDGSSLVIADSPQWKAVHVQFFGLMLMALYLARWVLMQVVT